MLSSFVRTRPVKFHQLLVRLHRTLMNLAVYTVNRIFLESFVDQTTITSLHLTHYRCPERHFYNKILEIDTSIPDTLVSAILILPVTLAPLTGFHAPKRRDICATKIRLLLLSVRVISNHPIINYCIQISESNTLAICFVSCFFVNACELSE